MQELPKIWLLGDSIRMSYQPHVARLLNGRAEVVGPAENCQYSLYTLSSLDRWLGILGKPDIIHWNNGLHDSGHNPRRNPVQIPIAMYLANLDFILARLMEFTPTVIWATTTPAHPDRPFRSTEWSWRNEEIDLYNSAARGLMEARGVPVTDLHKLVWERCGEFLADDKLHLSKAGQEACARAVADNVATRLRSRP